MNRRPSRLAALTLVLLASACSGPGTVGTSEKAADTATHDGAGYLDEAKSPLPPENFDRVQVNDGVFVGSVARRAEHGEPLPYRWQRPDGFTLRHATTMQLFEIGNEITSQTGIPVSFSPDIQTSGGAAAPPPAAPSFGPNINGLLGSLGLTPGAPGSPGGSPFAAGNLAGSSGDMIHAVTGNRASMKVDYSGRLSGFLDEVCAQFDVSWDYEGGQIRFFHNLTRTYTVHALPSSLKLSSSVEADTAASASSGTGGSSGANGQSSSKVNADISVEIWKDISGAVSGIVGDRGKVNTAVSTGTITVTAPPQVMSQVQEYLDGQNERLSKQVATSVQVLSVTLNDDDNYGFSLSSALSAGTKYGYTFAGPSAVALPLGASSLGMNIVGGKFSGTKAILQALSDKGRVTVKTTATVTTLNGVPAPLQVANTRGFVQSTTTTVTPAGTVGSAPIESTTINTATVTTGFSMSLLPRIDVGGDGLLMQFGINTSDLNGATNGFDVYTTPDGLNSVQLPNINSRNFVQQAYIPNGSTLVLAGYEQQQNNSTKSGVGDPGFMGLGGQQIGKKERDIIVILLTPIVLPAGDPMISTE
jgi:type IVB pilus formation R64 PilN family outer membrane protein